VTTDTPAGSAARRDLPAPPLLVITDRRQAKRPIERIVAEALAGGARWISVREKDLSAPERRALLRRLATIVAPVGTALAVHGDIEAAAELSLAGVHLPSGADPTVARRILGERALIGASTHGVDEAREAARRGADYVTIGPIFATASKPGYGPTLGVAGLRECCAAVPCPVIALGGVSPETAAACLAAGAAGIAIMGPIMRAADAAERTRDYTAALIAAPIRA
jgi:thiamine-phosphate pyrophosphorylase